MKPQCILCKAKDNKQVYKINGYRIYKCGQCKFMFTHPLPDKTDLNENYKEFSYFEGFTNEELIRKDAKRILSNLNALCTKKGKLLDLGSGAGFLLDEARKHGWKIQGVEIAKAPLHHAKNILKLPVIESDLNEIKIKEKYNVVILSQVIEHLSDPIFILKKIHELLENNGVACISTPNIESLLSITLGKDFNYLTPPNHIYFFSTQTIKKLIESCNFKILKRITYGYPEDIGIIYRRLRHNLKLMKDEPKISNHKINSTRNLEKMQKTSNNLKQKIYNDYFCNSYPLLDFFKKGSMIEVYIQKI